MPLNLKGEIIYLKHLGEALYMRSSLTSRKKAVTSYLFAFAFYSSDKTLPKKAACGGEFIRFTLHSASLRQARIGTEGRNLDTRTEADPVEECCLLTYTPWLAQPTSLYNPDHLLWADSGAGPSHISQ